MNYFGAISSRIQLFLLKFSSIFLANSEFNHGGTIFYSGLICEEKLVIKLEEAQLAEFELKDQELEQLTQTKYSVLIIREDVNNNK